MKKLLFAFLSLAGVGLASGSAQAGIFSALFRCHSCDETKICVKAYNAFSPTCFGSLTCNGCTPLSGGHGHGCGNGSCMGATVDGACLDGNCAAGFSGGDVITQVPGNVLVVPQVAGVPQLPPGVTLSGGQQMPNRAPQGFGYPTQRGWYQPAYGYNYGYPMPFTPVSYPNYWGGMGR